MITGLSDYQVTRIIRDTLGQGLSEAGLPGIKIKQLYQPRQSGIGTKPALYFFKVTSQRYGYPQLADRYNIDSNDFLHEETTWHTPTFQITGYAPQTPARSDVIKPKYFGFGIDSAAFNRGYFRSLTLDRDYTRADRLTPELMTASDMVNAAAAILQTQQAINVLLGAGIGITRITTIRQDYFTNDQGRYEQSPSFDFTVSYQNTVTNTIKPVNTYELETLPVL